MKKTVGLAGIAILAATTSAFAADMALKAPPAAPATVQSWAGLYAGVNAGAEWTDPRFTTTLGNGTGFFDIASLAFVNTLGTGSASAVGFISGAQLGYNWQRDKLVIGIEADFDGLSGKAALNGAGTTPGGSAVTISNTLSPNWMVTMRPRLGYAAGPWLLYITGGVGLLGSRYTQNFTNVTGGLPGGGSSSATATKAGGVLGGGLEYALSRTWSVRGEYLYGRFGNISAAGGVIPGAGNFSPLNGTASQTIQVARVAVNYHF